MNATVDSLELTRALIRCPSVTPADAGALDVLQSTLESLGFRCHRLPFGDGPARVDNLYARLGAGGRNFCFAGHTDVVPVGDEAAWTRDPFGAEINDGYLYGRGAADMKGAVGAFVAAAAGFLSQRGTDFGGSISLLITGDEEGEAVNGTAKVLEWLRAEGETLDHCLVGEPTNPTELGQMVKIGRRGSLNGVLEVRGVQGHTAYPHLADNPIHRLAPVLTALTAERWDDGTDHFQPTTLQFTTVDVGNPANNVVPGKVRAVFNMRFNDRHSGTSLEERLRAIVAAHAVEGTDIALTVTVNGEAFITPPGRLSELISAAVRKVTGVTPELSTTGGTSDARFIKDVCPVAEFGLVGQTMHRADERTAVGDIATLTEIYRAVLNAYFAD